MIHDAVRKRGGDRGGSSAPSASHHSTSTLRRSLNRLRRAVWRFRSEDNQSREVFLFIAGVTLLFFLIFGAVSYTGPRWMRNKEAVDEGWLLRRMCPKFPFTKVPALRRPFFRINATDSETAGSRREEEPVTFAFPVFRESGIPGQAATVKGLEAFCADHISAVPQWANGKWRLRRNASAPPGTSLESMASLFNLSINPKSALRDNYTAVGSPFCLYAGGFYLTKERIEAGGMDVFEKAGLHPHKLTDTVLRKSAASSATFGLHVVPAMGLLFNGHWIASHFFHLITDALETLYGAFHTMEDGALLHIPTQAVMTHRPGTNWVDRRGDTSKKMEFSAALANSFSSAKLRQATPYNTSFMFKPEMEPCVRLALFEGPPSPPPAVDGVSSASAVCFCDGLLVSVRRRGAMDGQVYYGIQEWAAHEFDAPPYVANRSVFAMEQLRQLGSPTMAARFWKEENASPVQASPGADLPTPVYKPRVLFVRRTTRLIANASLFADWMREGGFRVEEVYLESLSAAEQYQLGRYADVVVAMHGLGIGHGFWMEREPFGCRTVIEFRPWVLQSTVMQPFHMLAQAMAFRFEVILPVDVRFGARIKDPEKERAMMLSVERATSAYSFPAFTDQEAIYNHAEVQRVIEKVKRHLDRCLPK